MGRSGGGESICVGEGVLARSSAVGESVSTSHGSPVHRRSSAMEFPIGKRPEGLKPSGGAKITGSRARCIARRRTAARTDDRGSRQALHDVAGSGSRQSVRTQDDTLRALPAGRMARRRRTGEGALRVHAAIALTIGAGSPADRVGRTADMAGWSRAAEVTPAAGSAGARTIRAGARARGVVTVALDMTGRRAAGEIAALAPRTGAGSIGTVAGRPARGDQGPSSAECSHDDRPDQARPELHQANGNPRQRRKPPPRRCLA